MGACCRKLSYEEKLYGLQARTQQLEEVIGQAKLELAEIVVKRQRLENARRNTTIERARKRETRQRAQAPLSFGHGEQVLGDPREPDNRAV